MRKTASYQPTLSLSARLSLFCERTSGCGHELMTDFNGIDPSVSLERERRSQKRKKKILWEKELYPKTRF